MNKRQIRGMLILFGVVAAGCLGIWAYNWMRGGHRYWVNAAAFNSDGTLLATAGGDDHVAEIILWDVAKTRQLVRYELDSGRPRWISFSKDRQVVLYCDVVGKSVTDYRPSEITIIDLNRRAIVDSFAQPDVAGGAVALEQTQRLVVYSPRTIELRELAGGERKMLMSDHEAGVDEIGVSLDERHLVAACNGVARVWDLQLKTELPALDAQGIDLGKIAIADGGSLVAATNYDLFSNAETFSLIFWDRAQGTSAVNVLQLEQPVTDLRFLPGALPRLLVVSGKDHLDCRVGIYDPTNGRQLQELYTGNAAIKAVDVTPAGTRLVWANSRGGGELWTLENPDAGRLWKETVGELQLVRFSPDTQLLVGRAWGPEVSLLDAKTGKQVAELKAYQPSGSSLYLYYVLGLLLFVFGIDWFTKLKARHRKEGMRAVAKQLGWQHTSGALPDGIPEFHFFAKRSGGRFEHVLLGPGENYDTLLAVYRWMQGSGDKRSPAHQLCVIYPHLRGDLPEVFIRPESFADKLAEYIGFSDVDLDDTGPLKRFSARYLLRTKVPQQMPDLISDSLADFLCDHEGWNVEIVDGSVLLWWQVVKSFSTSRFPVSETAGIRDFLDESRIIVELLVPEVAGRKR